MNNKHINKVQLVYPRENYGLLTQGAKSSPQIGPLILGRQIKDELGIDVEIYNENYMSSDELLSKLDGDVIGFSTRCSNSQSTIKLLENISQRKNPPIIIFGGPNVTELEEKILTNRPAVYYVITGEAEQSLLKLLRGDDLKKIGGLTYRANNKIISNPITSAINLNEIREFDLEQLKSPYQWNYSNKNKAPLMSAFPLSGLRGCFRKTRCDWCSISTINVRTVSGEKYWSQVKKLNEKYGIDLFYESGDTLMPFYAKELANTKPKDLDIRLRCYSHIGLISEDYLTDLKKCGVTNIFLGIESVKVQHNKYSGKKLQEDLELLKKENFQIMGGFILGMPGETEETLKANISNINALMEQESFCPVINLNTPYPLPGSKYYQMCLEDTLITKRYEEITRENLIKTDTPDVILLSKLFVDRYSNVSYAKVYQEINKLVQKYPERIAYWALGETK